MKKIDNFIGKYPLSKTLRFSLLPVGKTEENFNSRLLLEEDENRAIAYERVKQYIDRYHKVFIERVLSGTILDDVAEYAALYYKTDKTEKEIVAMDKIAASMCKFISKSFTSSKMYKTIFSKEMVTEILPEFLTDENELKDVEMFRNFYTYFTGFNDNRRNIYAEDKKTSIAYRCINENLPMFLDNCRSFQRIIDALPSDTIKKLNDDFSEIYNIDICDIFSVDYFSFVLSQAGIDKYNSILGGYTCSDGTKIQGLNEYINLFNQQVARKDKSLRLPKIKPLYKQILSEKESVSFIPEKFKNDDEVISSIKEFYESTVCETIIKIKELFEEFDSFNSNEIYLSSGVAVTNISNAVFGSWSAVVNAWNDEYEKSTPLKKGKSYEEYDEKKKKQYKNILSFSLTETQRLGMISNPESKNNVIEWFKSSVKQEADNILSNYSSAYSLLEQSYSENHDKKLAKNDEAIALIKNLLDSIKELERTLKPLLGTGKEDEKDALFYGRFTELYTTLSLIDGLYDKVRNYITQKPYSKDKIKLNFQSSYFLNGWSQSYETKGAMLFRENERYYIGIFDRRYSGNEISKLTENVEQSRFERIVYDFQKPDNKNTPRLFIRSKGDSFAPSVSKLGLPINDIIDIYDNGYFKTEYKKVDENNYKKSLIKMIDYFKEGFCKHESYKHYNFHWKPSTEYRDISEFYKDTIESCYELRFEKINRNVINNLVNCGDLYLFQIYNKDFSENKKNKGTDNLHTMYFKMLFDERNLADVVYQLNGGAEMFYRKASIKEKEQVIHPANMPIENKNPDKTKATSTFKYDIVKDRRFTKRQFSLHIPITLNFKAEGREFVNYDVRKAIKECDENYIIGIDRGERNLLYICVINGKGEIIEQKSLNEIISNGHKVDYHKLLDQKETDRDKARKEWTTVENIKELKEGYLSQVVHEICRLVVKYDALIAMEDLNFGFKNGRFKVEKQVYQKFENMLISKLNYLVDKNCEATENGGLLKAYQLTNKDTGVKNRGKQNGFIFYVPAELTSKIDPTTGFVDLLHPKYTNINDAICFIEKIDAIRYNRSEELFEFDIDYTKFNKTNASYRKNWTLCSYGERIRSFRNPQKNNEWDNESVVLTDKFKELFEQYGIDISGNIKSQMLQVNTKDFYEKFIKLFALMLQMRNSETGNVDIDYLIFPVRNSDGVFFKSEKGNKSLPENADANGAYNIARKAMWAVEVIKNTPENELDKANLLIRKADWLEYTQK